MANKQKSWFEKHPVWTGIIGFLILMVLINMFSGGDKSVKKIYVCPDGSEVNNPNNCPNELEDYSPQVKNEGILDDEKNFSFTFNQTFKQPPIKNIDCSKKENFNISQIEFKILRTCKTPDGNIAISHSDEEGCRDFWKGEYIPTLYYDAYPSLKEYKFYGVAGWITNTGCTKLNISDFYVIYGLYQNGKLIKENVEKIFSNFEIGFIRNEFLYPEEFVGPQFRFGGYLSPEPVIRENPHNYTFKIYFVYKPSMEVVSTDEVNFDMIKK